MADTLTVSDLRKKHCKACESGTPPLTEGDVRKVLREVPGWELAKKEIAKTYKFANYYETMAFVNAIAWISHKEDHHPDLEVGYNKCKVTYSTHSEGGITQKDLACAGKIEQLMKL